MHKIAFNKTSKNKDQKQISSVGNVYYCNLKSLKGFNTFFSQI